MSRHLSNSKKNLLADLREMRQLVRDLETGLTNKNTDWSTLSDIARDLEADAWAFACMCRDNYDETMESK